MDNIFFQISTLLAITVSLAFLIRLLRQPLIIAYIVAGIIAGPMFFNLLHGDRHMYEAFAQFGVVLLLFIIGLNLNFNHLKSIGRASFITGIGQVLFTSLLGTLLLLALKMPFTTSVILAVAITFSSTIIIMKLLSDKKDTETVYGRHTIGLMLVQDIIAVAIMIVIVVLKEGGALAGPFVVLAIKGVWAVAGIYVLSKYLLPRLLHRIANSSELLFIFTVSWCFGLASLLYWLGFSLEIGAIAAGIALSSSPYQLEIASRIKPLRDFFLVLFFIVLGSEMAVGTLSAVWLPGLALALFILIGNPLILYILFRSLKFTRRNSFLAGLTAAQVSEFGFVLLFTAGMIWELDGSVIPIFTLVAIITIFISSYLIIYSEKIYRFLLPFFSLFGPDRYRQRNRVPAVYDIWLVGYHRIGNKVCETLKGMKAKFSVIDYDPGAISELRRHHVPAVYGDIADMEFLETLPIASAKLVIMTIPSLDDQIGLIKHVRGLNPTVAMIANAYQYDDAALLYRAGADFVMMPHLLGASWIASLIKKKKLSRKHLAGLKDEQAKTAEIRISFPNGSK